MEAPIDLLNLYIASCRSNAKKNSQSTIEAVTITHAVEIVTVPVNPDRIVVFGYGALENIDFIDENVVGISKTSLPHLLSNYRNSPSITKVGNPV